MLLSTASAVSSQGEERWPYSVFWLVCVSVIRAEKEEAEAVWAFREKVYLHFPQFKASIWLVKTFKTLCIQCVYFYSQLCDSSWGTRFSTNYLKICFAIGWEPSTVSPLTVVWPKLSVTANMSNPDERIQRCPHGGHCWGCSCCICGKNRVNKSCFQHV